MKIHVKILGYDCPLEPPFCVSLIGLYADRFFLNKKSEMNLLLRSVYEDIGIGQNEIIFFIAGKKLWKDWTIFLQ